MWREKLQSSALLGSRSARPAPSPLSALSLSSIFLLFLSFTQLRTVYLARPRRSRDLIRRQRQLARGLQRKRERERQREREKRRACVILNLLPRTRERKRKRASIYISGRCRELQQNHSITDRVEKFLIDVVLVLHARAREPRVS